MKLNWRLTTLVLVPYWIQEVVSVFYQSLNDGFLSDHEIKPLNAILNMDWADGKSFPYLGCVKTNITEIEGMPEMTSTSCLFFATPNTHYSNKTPVLLGTNILDEQIDTCKIIHGQRYLQFANRQIPWFLAFRAIAVREKQLRRNKNRVIIVWCAENSKLFWDQTKVIIYKEIQTERLITKLRLLLYKNVKILLCHLILTSHLQLLLIITQIMQRL